MQRLRTIVADDEPLALKFLVSLLEKRDDIELIAQCKNGTEVLSALRTTSADLLILDIQMPGYNGFEVVKHIPNQSLPLVIFVTAFDQYAVDAFKVHAVDYLLKPVDLGLFEQAIQRCHQRYLQTSGAQNTKEKILGALEHISDNLSAQNTQALEPLVIKERDTITLLEHETIDWIDAAGDYMCIHARGQTHIVRSTLKGLLKELQSTTFQQVHRSTVVNISKVEQIKKLPKSEYLLVLRSGDRIKVSRNYRNVVRDFLNKL